ncbi:lactococcin 972 family bacteriocin [Thermoanaerobacterium thermosaccharolyticum]|uniref:lactococcin 972 family bacteriocin n=1 Tax=Thermoanaerobacterium thermosaccharolyticum TaxID=1517 RepID=UPI003DA9E3CC
MLKKYVLIAMVICSILTLSVGAQAFAASKGGAVELTNADVTPFTVTIPDEGGTWNYGTSKVGQQKHVWSYYIHPDYKHHATAVLGPQIKTAIAEKGKWAKADVYGPTKYIGYAYYGIDK